LYADDLGIVTRDLTDRELFLFDRAMKYIIGQYYVTTQTILQASELDLSPGERLILQELAEIKAATMSRGYLTIGHMLQRFFREFLMGAMIAKYDFDKNFAGEQPDSGKFYVVPLKREIWKFEDDVGGEGGLLSERQLTCLVGFGSQEAQQPSFSNARLEAVVSMTEGASSPENVPSNVVLPSCLQYTLDGKRRQNEIIWIRDNDIYVCSLPQAIILRPRWSVIDLGNTANLNPIGVLYVSDWRTRE
jgi:hypothetical protein